MDETLTTCGVWRDEILCRISPASVVRRCSFKLLGNESHHDQHSIRVCVSVSCDFMRMMNVLSRLTQMQTNEANKRKRTWPCRIIKWKGFCSSDSRNNSFMQSSERHEACVDSIHSHTITSAMNARLCACVCFARPRSFFVRCSSLPLCSWIARRILCPVGALFQLLFCCCLPSRCSTLFALSSVVSYVFHLRFSFTVFPALFFLTFCARWNNECNVKTVVQ